jgi:serine/threonine protein kinase
VLVDQHGRLSLADFGLTAITENMNILDTTTINKVGAVRWMAPEVRFYGVISLLSGANSALF